MIFRLEKMSKRGVEGTVLGTLCMPYLSGLGNLVFVFVVLNHSGDGSDVMINCLVNNATNMTLLLGLPAVIWGLTVIPQKNKKSGKRAVKVARVQRLSLVLTIAAMVIFTGIFWALAQDRYLSRGDGMVLIALFLFWQGFHVYEVLKENILKPNRASKGLLSDGIILLICGGIIYVSIDMLVTWIMKIDTGFISKEQLGLLSGWLMVLPNGILALYYAATKRPDVVYSSQLGDGHICIPLCVGLYAALQPFSIRYSYDSVLLLIAATSVIHAVCLIFIGRLPKLIASLLVATYILFIILLPQ